VLLILGGITKRAQIPFSSWLPAAIAAPTPVSSLVHSSTLVTAGVYLFFRFYYLFFTGGIRRIFCWVSLMTSFFAGIMACFEVDLKKLVAISTLSQLGLIIFIISTGDLYLCYFHIVSHALFKALLFLRCGLVIIIALGGQDIRFIGSQSYSIRGVFIFILVANMSLVGVPFLSGFYSRDIILEIFYAQGGLLMVYFVLVLSCCLSVVYSLKLMGVGINITQLNLPHSNKYFFKSNTVFMGLLCLWAVILGKLYLLFLLKCETPLVIFIRKIVGIFILLGGVVAYIFVNLTIQHVYFYYGFEIGYINYFWGDFFTKNIFLLGVFQRRDSFWSEFLLVKWPIITTI